MATISPLRAFRPRPDVAAAVASVPYDVVDRDEALALAGDERSFLHVTKPEIDLPAETDHYADAVYEKGLSNLEKLIAEGVLVRDSKPSFYVYALTMGGHTQTGLVFGASVAEYERNFVRKHEFTRPDKENDRVRHIETTRAQTGKVFLVHPKNDVVAAQIAKARAQKPHTAFKAPDGVTHELWTIDDPKAIAILQNAFDAIGPIYIADGHHRSAAASRVAQANRAKGTASADTEMFLSVSFPADEVRIMPYNRVVKDLNGLSPDAFLKKVGEQLTVREGKPKSASHVFGMYLGGKWYTLEAANVPSDPVGRLDVSILQDRLLAPILGIKDPRRDTRIAFVGGIRGDQELVKRVDAGEAVAFSLHPTSIEDLFAIADSENVMPPKSTWFEPKLRDGLVLHRF